MTRRIPCRKTDRTCGSDLGCQPKERYGPQDHSPKVSIWYSSLDCLDCPCWVDFVLRLQASSSWSIVNIHTPLLCNREARAYVTQCIYAVPFICMDRTSEVESYICFILHSWVIIFYFHVVQAKVFILFPRSIESFRRHVRIGIGSVQVLYV